MFCIGGDDVYAQAGNDRAAGGGGWNNTNPDEEPPENEEMDESSDDGGEGGSGVTLMSEVPDQVVEELIYPEPSRRALTYDPARGGLWFHFDRQRIPHALQTLAPNVLKAMAGWTEATEIHGTAIALQPAMPMPVHSSPLISMLANQHLPNETPAQMLKRPCTWMPKYTSWVRSCYQLHQWKELALNDVVTLHASITPDARTKMVEEYYHQLRAMETKQNIELDALYDAAGSGALDRTATLSRFISLLECYSLQYIHLLEYFLFSLLVAPYGPTIELDMVLTPNDTPSLGDCQACGQFVVTEVVRDMRVFLRSKYATRDAQINSADASHFQPRKDLLFDATAPEPGRGETWRGYMPRDVLFDYMCFFDCDGKLK